ncbi:MAG TPA: hypothetical protein VF630_05405 [Hymenobacter sp.]|jgi:hypothetical protein
MFGAFRLFVELGAHYWDIIAGTLPFTLYQPGCDSVRVTHQRFDKRLTESISGRTFIKINLSGESVWLDELVTSARQQLVIPVSCRTLVGRLASLIREQLRLPFGSINAHLVYFHYLVYRKQTHGKR